MRPPNSTTTPGPSWSRRSPTSSRWARSRITGDDNAGIWYDDFCRFLGEVGAFATLMTPAGYGDDARWDTWRNCHFNEITAFYSLGYWYAWQVSMLGLGPIWMGENKGVKERAAHLLREGRHLRLRPLRTAARRRHLLQRDGG